jgi:hypothetical protein
MEETRFQRVPGLHVNSSILVDRLKQGKPGDILTDEQLTALIGVSTKPGCKGYAFLSTAIKRCLNEHKVVWKRTRGAWCIKCLIPDEIMLTAKDNSKKIHRISNRSIRMIDTVDPATMPAEKRGEYFARSAQFGTLKLFSEKSTHEKLVTRNISQPFDMSKMLEAMR